MHHGGKERIPFMEKVVYASLGKRSGRVVVGPGLGLDNGVVSLGRGRVMIVTADPVSAVPAFGMRLSAWMSVHLIASDFTASGADPQFAAFAYNFPPSMTPDQKEGFVRAVGAECSRLGVAIVAGHTGSYPGGGFTVIGSGVMFGTSPRDGYVTPSMARVGDRILMTKHAAIEATSTLARSFPRYLGERVGTDAVRRASSMTRLCTTVEDARTARGAGLGGEGVSSMHDATEGGVLGALQEMATASAKAFVVDPEKVRVTDEAKAVCEAFGIDPLGTMGEGALLLTCARERVPEVERRMSRAAIPVTEVGYVRAGRGLWLARRGGRTRLEVAGPDGFWAAYDRASGHGLC